MSSLIRSTRSMGLVGASEACRGFDGEVGGGAVVDFFFVISIRGRRGKRGRRFDLRGPALRSGRRRHLLFSGIVVREEFGTAMSSADGAPMLMSAFAGSGPPPGFDAG